MDLKVTNICHKNNYGAGRYFPINKATLLLAFQFHFFVRSVSATKLRKMRIALMINRALVICTRLLFLKQSKKDYKQL